MSKQNLIAFMSALGLAAFIWAFDRWISPRPEAMPIMARIAFTVALTLLGGQLMEEMSRLQGIGLQKWFQRGAAAAVFWYCLMIINAANTLPSKETLLWLPGAAVVGWIAGRRPVATDPLPEQHGRRHQFWWMVGLVVMTVTLATVPLGLDPAYLLFNMILAMSVATPGLGRGNSLKWDDWLLVIIGTVALVAGVWLAN